MEWHSVEKQYDFVIKPVNITTFLPVLREAIIQKGEKTKPHCKKTKISL